jgi:uncharacterized protein YlxP (DUF503 family)
MQPRAGFFFLHEDVRRVYILLLQLEVHIPSAQSLKDKRSVLKSLLHKLRTTYNVSVSEVGNQDLWQSVELAVVMVGSSSDVLDGMERGILDTIEGGFDVVLTAINRQWL